MKNRNYLLKQWPLLIAMTVVTILMWVLNYLTPIHIDDYWYNYVFDSDIDFFDYSRPIKSFQDVLVSQYHHYFGFNGRTLIHIIVQTFAGLLGKEVFNVFNAIAYTVLATLLARLSGKLNTLNFIFCASLIFLFPQFNKTVLWMSGAVNYLWTSIAICLFIILFEHLRIKTLQPKHFLWLIPSLAIGWTHEGIVFPMSLSLGIYCVIYRKSIVNSAVIPLIIGFIIGALICTFAPSIIGRTGIASDTSFINLKKIHYGIAACLSLKAIWILVAALAIMAFKKKRDFWSWLKRFYIDNMIFCNAMILSFSAVFVSGMREPRTAIGVEFFAIIILLRIINSYNTYTINLLKCIISTCCAVLYGIVLYLSIPNYATYKDVVSRIKNRQNEIIPVNKNNNSTRYFDSYILNAFQSVLIYNPMYLSIEIASFFGSEHIGLLPEVIYNDIMTESIRLTDIHLQADYPAYIIPLDNDTEFNNPVFICNPQDFSSIPFYKRPFLSREIWYTAEEIPINTGSFDTFELNGRKYLYIVKDSRIEPRLKDIVLR